MANIGAKKMFALVVDSVTKEPRRLIDTGADADDSFLLKAQQNVAADETMILLAIEDYPVRKPYIVAAALGYKSPVIDTQDPPEVTAAKDKAVFDIAPVKASLDLDDKSDFLARVKEVLSSGKLPRNDLTTRQLLAAEMQRIGKTDISTALLTGAPEASFYVASVVETLLPSLEADIAVAVISP